MVNKGTTILFYPQHLWLLEPNTPKAQYLGLPRVSPISRFLDPPPLKSVWNYLYKKYITYNV